MARRITGQHNFDAPVALELARSQCGEAKTASWRLLFPSATEALK
jgi:hypothetical protein